MTERRVSMEVTATDLRVLRLAMESVVEGNPGDAEVEAADRKVLDALVEATADLPERGPYRDVTITAVDGDGDMLLSLSVSMLTDDMLASVSVMTEEPQDDDPQRDEWLDQRNHEREVAEVLGE